MKTLKFKTWLEMADFGFDKDIADQQNQKPVETPVDTFNIEEMARILSRRKLPGREAWVKFVNEIYWGTSKQAGDIKVDIRPGLSIAISKLGKDLLGEDVWILKRYYQINRAGYGGYEVEVADEIFEQVQWIDKRDLDAPKKEYKQLENLVIALANKMRRVAREIFYFDGVTRLNESNYIVKFNVRGQGNEAPDQRRVVQNETNVSFNKKRGVIRMINNNVESAMRGHSWGIMPMDDDFYFFPTQSKEEMIETMATAIRWY
jgi:hypothetical protein